MLGIVGLVLFLASFFVSVSMEHSPHWRIRYASNLVGWTSLAVACGYAVYNVTLSK